MTEKTVIKILTENKLKVTPQRMTVLEVITGLKTHPTAENIVEQLRLKIPHVTIGTVYNILDTFVEKGIITRVKTDTGQMRYDPVLEKHHHLYCAESERIEDYFDNDLDKIIEDYLKKKKIPNFKIKEIKLQIIGKFTDSANTKIDIINGL